MDWFESITGFRELAYEETQAKLWVEDGRLCSKHSANRYAVGTLETPTLADLRRRVASSNLREGDGRIRVGLIVGDADAVLTLTTALARQYGWKCCEDNL